MAAVRAELESLRHHHSALEEAFGDLSRAALTAVVATGMEGHLLPDRLHALPLRVRDLVTEGIREGGATSLAALHARNWWDLHRFLPGFPG